MSDIRKLGKRLESIGKFRTSHANICKSDITALVANYWFSLPKLGLIPERKEIQPRAIASVLPHIVLLEQTDNIGLNIRLFGTGNTERWGLEPTGTDFLSWVTPDSRDAIVAALSTLHTTPCGVIIHGDELYVSGEQVRTESAFFPMRPAEGRARVLFGSIVMVGDPGIADTERTLASAFYRLSDIHYINIGAGIPG